MKKSLVPLTLMVILLALMLPASLDAEIGEINAIAGGGYAFSDYEGFVAMLGLEVGIRQNLFIQGMVDLYPNPLPDAENANVNYTVMGMNIFAVYKMKPSEKFSLFAKAGVGFSSLKFKTDLDGVPLQFSDSDYGVAGGAGFEFMMSDRFGIIFGGDVHYLFATETINWYKIYGGVTFKIK